MSNWATNLPRNVRSRYVNETPVPDVTAGTYTNATVTVDTQGRVTSASNGSASGTAGDYIRATSDQNALYTSGTTLIYEILSGSAGSSISYNTVTGVATINVTGIYLVCCSVFYEASASGAEICVNGAAVDGGGMWTEDPDFNGTVTVPLSLNAGDLVSMVVRAGETMTTMASARQLFGFSIIRFR